MGVAQLVELRVVVPAAAGSSPVAHPQETRANADLSRSDRAAAYRAGAQIGHMVVAQPLSARQRPTTTTYRRDALRVMHARVDLG